MSVLYPSIEPYEKGYLKVSDGYEIYYELSGNPKGKPVLYLHGGPGAGTSPRDRMFFNPKKYNIILFDQRGAGKSRPFASVKNNTTQKLVGDIRALLKHLDIKKVLLFGGSWGSTLALVYAIKYPKTVTGMLLRGIYLATKEDNNDFFGGGTKDHFPEAWERFIGHVPKAQRKDIIPYYMKMMLSNNKKVSDFYAYEWSFFESSMLKLKNDEKKIKKHMKKGRYKSLGPLEAHYIGNICFLPDNYIPKNASKLSGIPTVIIHGRYDMICRPINAYVLHKLIKGSKLYFTFAGHSSSDGGTVKKTVEEMDKFANILK